MTDLSLISTDELIEALSVRYDAFIFCGQQVGMGGPDKIVTTRKWQGNSATCAGLASQIQIAVYDILCEETEDPEECEM